MADEKYQSFSNSTSDVEKQDPAFINEARRASNVSEAAATVLKHAIDADEAMKAFAGREGEVIHIDEATNKRLLKIIDWNLMPLSALDGQLS
jgi:MFS transporter, ACS family, allantoate permease